MKSATVKHGRFGEGEICAVEGRYVSVSFGGTVKKFTAERFFDFFTADHETVDALKGEIAAALEAEKKREREEEEARKERQRVREEEERRQLQLREEEERRKEEERREREERSPREALLKKLKSFGFEGFLHTTEFYNFQKIVESGYLYSRAELKRMETPFSDRGKEDIIAMTDSGIKNHARFYYRFNTPTNFGAHYSRPVILVFDEDLIFEKDVEFSLGNAASYHSLQTRSARNALECDWTCVFEEGDPRHSKYLPKQNKDMSEEETEEWKEGWARMYAKVKRLRNAEFLYPVKVPISRIVRVYFYFEADRKKAETFCNEALRSKFVCDPSKFEFYR